MQDAKNKDLACLFATVNFSSVGDATAGISNSIYLGGHWKQSLGGAGPHQVFRKNGSDKNIPMLSNIFIFILRRGPKLSSCGLQLVWGPSFRDSYARERRS